MYHHLSVQEVFAKLGTAKEGLSAQEVTRRQKEHGLNVLPQKRELLWFEILSRQLASPFTVILGGAALISFLLGRALDVIVIGGALALNIAIGFIQEYQAERAMRALKAYLPQEAVVVRGGTVRKIKAAELVIGDIVLVAAGDKIAADLRVVDAVNLEANEAQLTGESLPVPKNAAVVAQGATVLEQRGMLFSGSVVTRGHGTGAVAAIGRDTYFGKIAEAVSVTKETPTPLQKRLKDLARRLTIAVLALSSLLFLLGLLRGHPFQEIFTVSVAVAVAAVPEGLAVAVAVILTIALRRMLNRKALVKRLVAAETLGATTLICVDKTGTVTEGTMRVAELHPGEDAPDVREELFHAMVFANEAIREEVHDGAESRARTIGDPTDIALLDAASAAGFEPLYHKKEELVTDSIPFESENQFMAVLVDGNPQSIYFKGAAEKLLPQATSFLGKDGVHHRLQEPERKAFTALHDSLSVKGLRLLMFARRDLPEPVKHITDLDNPLADLIFLGFAALEDPIREGVESAVKEVLGAGVKLALITGDHMLTAQNVSKKLGIGDHHKVLLGKAVADMSNEELVKRVGDAAVFARTLPHEKLRIVDAFQAAGDVVAMTGDGINDAPAMKAADIGIALGSGTDVAKETAEMVLLDNNFATIVAAIKEGRIIFENIRKVALFLLFDSFSEVLLVATAVLFGLPLPLTAAMILWVNLIEDGPPVFALAFERGEKDVMRRPPRNPKEQILPRQLLILILAFGILAGLLPVSLFVYFITHGASIAWAQTLMFAAIAFDSFTTIFSIRSLRAPVWRMNPFENLWIVGAVLFGIGMTVIATLLPPLRGLLGTVPLSINDWALVGVIGIANLFLLELLKAAFFRRIFRSSNQ